MRKHRDKCERRGGRAVQLAKLRKFPEAHFNGAPLAGWSCNILVEVLVNEKLDHGISPFARARASISSLPTPLAAE
jgi:hypothetical protein